MLESSFFAAESLHKGCCNYIFIIFNVTKWSEFFCIKLFEFKFVWSKIKHVFLELFEYLCFYVILIISNDLIALSIAL
jgi:hypothetical protein